MTVKRILLLGAYGNFGQHITHKLAYESDIQLILAGRSLIKLKNLVAKYRDVANPIEISVFDINKELSEKLKDFQPDIVIHTCGPYQNQNYAVAKACIKAHCHYIDLADGRDYVNQIVQLNEEAKNNKVSIISGASSVPCLISAVIDHYKKEFSQLQSIDSGIATSQRINVGLATTKGTLSYAGKPFTTLKNAKMQRVYGWQGITKRNYPILGKRYFSYCDIPDLDLAPKRYPSLTDFQFRVSLEVPIVHWTMWGLSWLSRWRLLSNLPNRAGLLVKLSKYFDRLGSDDSGFHVKMKGLDYQGNQKEITYYLLAKDRYGPFIPSTPAIICAKKLVRGNTIKTGAFPCLDIVTLGEYIDALDSDKIEQIIQ